MDLTLLSNDICSSTYLFKVTEFMLCAGDMEGRKDTCVVSLPNPWESQLVSDPSMAMHSPYLSNV